MTVLDLLTAEATVLNAIGVGEPLPPEDGVLLLQSTNLYIESLNALVKKSLFANYDPSLFTFLPVADLVNLTDLIALPQGWIRALQYNVAVDVAPMFGKAVSQELAKAAAESRAAILTPAPSVA